MLHFKLNTIDCMFISNKYTYEELFYHTNEGQIDIRLSSVSVQLHNITLSNPKTSKHPG